MGLGTHIIEAILREHQHKPITGDVLLIGRQTTYLTAEKLLLRFGEHGMKPDVDPGSFEFDKSTIDRKYGDTERLVSDSMIFKLLGARSVKALDHSAYEGAEVIHDLRRPVPTALHGIADFVVDGSTLDNVFTPSIVLQNYASLLRPGGRLLMENAFSAHNSAYVMMPPLWYVDYFVINRFADCKPYIVLYMEDENKVMFDSAFYLDLDELARLGREMPRFVSPHQMVTIIFAEKGERSTVDRLPNQQDYRSADEWTEYHASLDVIRQSKRHHLLRTRSKKRGFMTSITGHPFIDWGFLTHP